ncbi:Cytochrome [Forsythia ovata]|uniref:Cytochrome n=1 Tax=Forsythia ovata TaxID=205694 RepID=A0ABD1RJD7_9LAMI
MEFYSRFLVLGQVPNHVVSSAEMAEQVLRKHVLECCSRTYSYGAMKLSYNLLEVAFGPCSEYWRELRKISVIELFIVKRSSRDPIEVNEKIFSLTNNIVCSIAFGKSYDGKQFEGYYKFQVAIDEAMAMLSSFWAVDFFPNFGWILDVTTGLHKRLENCFVLRCGA